MCVVIALRLERPVFAVLHPLLPLLHSSALFIRGRIRASVNSDFLPKADVL